MPGDAPLPAHVRRFVVGAGFGGLGMAIALQQSGERDFLVADKGSSVGGTWRDNTYPGATCDIPSQLYSFSFAHNPEWSRSYSPQPEIWAYLCRVAEEAGVLDRFVFDTEVQELRWDDDALVWHVTTSAGSLTADVVVSASGGLSEPRMPDIDGLEEFTGPLFHTARWDHTVDLTGKRVAVIGTGASAIQIVPQVAKVAAHVDVYQRTPPWVMGRGRSRVLRLERWGFRHLPRRAVPLPTRHLPLDRVSRADVHPLPAGRPGAVTPGYLPHGTCGSATPRSARSSRPTTRWAASGS